MVYPKKLPEERLSAPVYVCLRPAERQALDELARVPGGSRSRVLREAVREYLARQESTSTD